MRYTPDRWKFDGVRGIYIHDCMKTQGAPNMPVIIEVYPPPMQVGGLKSTPVVLGITADNGSACSLSMVRDYARYLGNRLIESAALIER